MTENNFDHIVALDIDVNIGAVVNILRKMKREKTHDEIVALRVYDYIENVSDEVRERFWAHGISRGSDSDKLRALIAILKTSMIKGWSGRMVHQSGTFMGATFLLLSKVDKELFDKAYMKEKIDAQQSEDFVVNGIKANIEAVVINDEMFFPLIPLLQKKFPNIEFLKPNQLLDYFQRQLPNERIEMTPEEAKEREFKNSTEQNSII